MKAMLLKEYKKLELVELPKPEIGANDLLVQVKACGICGSDIHGYDGSTGRRVPPLVMGLRGLGSGSGSWNQRYRLSCWRPRHF
ncbi:MAG: alcohol dehydrogenase catalytic domain-containing protein [Pirellulales bacterium]